MKIIQTLYCKDDDFFRNSYGWLSPAYNMFSWTLSALQLMKYYDNVELYTNSNAAKFLIDVLKLPYKKIILSHDKLDIIDTRLWALPKIYSYSLQEEPFLHIDGDVFIFSRFFDSVPQNSHLIAQNYEIGSGFYGIAQQDLMNTFTYFPPCVKRDFTENYPVNGINAGVLGGSDISFFQKYTSYAFKYIERNRSKLDSLSFPDRFNVFFEQHLFFALSKETKTPINMLFPGFVTDNQYRNMGNFCEVPYEKQYLHLLGHYKRDEMTCLRLAETLKKIYPDYYYKIISLCEEKNISYPLTSFYKNKFESYKKFELFNNECKMSFLNNSSIISKKTDQKVAESNLNHLNILKRYLKNLEDVNLDLTHLKKDLISFSKKIIKTLKDLSINDNFLYGRDLDSLDWGNRVFNNKEETKNQKLKQCAGSFVIKSKYDWAAILKAEHKIGAEYYDNFKIVLGDYYCLVIPEININKISLNDIDEFEYIVFNLLAQPATINEILTYMQQFVEEDVILSHYNIFEELILAFLKNLINIKAISPVL